MSERAPLRRICYCPRPFFADRPHTILDAPYTFTAPLRLHEAFPGGFDIVDQEDMVVNLWPMCIHHAAYMLAYVSAAETSGRRP